MTVQFVGNTNVMAVFCDAWGCPKRGPDAANRLIAWQLAHKQGFVRVGMRNHECPKHRGTIVDG